MQKIDPQERTKKRRGCRYWLNLFIVAIVAFTVLGIIGYDAMGNHIVFRGIAWRTGQRQPLSVVEVIGDIAPRPLLLIATRGEESIEQRVVQNYFAETGEPKELWSIPDVGHGGGARAHAREYARRLVSFYDEAPALTEAHSEP